jgi:integrase
VPELQETLEEPQLRASELGHLRAAKDRNLHFHDLRGTAATRFYTAGLSERVIAEIMGWEEEYVAKIIRRYVGRAAATKAVIAQLDQARRRT